MKLPFRFKLPQIPASARESFSKNLYHILAIVFIIAILIGYIFFYISFVNPALATRNQVANQVSAARKAAVDRGVIPESPDSLQARLNNSRATVTAAQKAFLTDAQVSAAIKALYQYADESKVTLLDLKTQIQSGVIAPTPAPRSPTPAPTAGSTSAPQAGTPPPTPLVSVTPTRAPSTATLTLTPQPTPTIATSDLFRVTTVQLQARAPANQLVEFVARINETMLKGVVVNVLNIDGDEKSAILTLELVMYSSPTGSGEGVPRPITPVIVATPILGMPTSIPAVPTQIVPPPPPPPPVLPTSLPAIPTATVTVFPTVPPPTATAPPARVIYIVRAGDTLYSIARRYNTTVEAIMAANRLTSQTIYVGQQLIIP